MTIGEFWKRFLSEVKMNEDEAGFAGEIAFDGTGAFGAERLSLALGGRKTAIFSAFDSYEINRENLPVTGELYILEDAQGEPVAVIEIDGVSVVLFSEIPWDLAARDGEDENLEEWREKTRFLMEDEATLCGFEFSPSSKIVCETFRVVFRQN